MSVMGSQRRKIGKLHKDRVAVIRAAFKPEEYMKHKPHQKALLRAINEDRARQEHEALVVGS